MPKFKCATAAQCVWQAKKRKRSQREDPVRLQEEQECNTARSRNAIQQVDNEFLWIRQKEVNKNKNLILQLTKEFLKVIQKVDTKTSNVIP